MSDYPSMISIPSALESHFLDWYIDKYGNDSLLRIRDDESNKVVYKTAFGMLAMEHFENHHWKASVHYMRFLEYVYDLAGIDVH